jgi:hypothetical protein
MVVCGHLLLHLLVRSSIAGSHPRHRTVAPAHGLAAACPPQSADGGLLHAATGGHTEAEFPAPRSAPTLTIPGSGSTHCV